MPRLARLHKPGDLHHVTCRTARGSPAFLDDEDRRSFVRVLSEFEDRFEVGVAAFCQMTNHYHLLLSGSVQQLGLAMHRLGFLYTQRFNHRHGFTGSLFSDRYYSNPVRDESYHRNAVRYIHRNPLAIDPRMDLGRYPWSSHGVYMGLQRRPWVVSGPTLDLFGRSRRVFDEFVQDPTQDVRRVLLADVHEVVCDVTHMSRDEVVECGRRKQNDALPLFSLLAREVAGIQSNQIGPYIGRSASTVRNLHAKARRQRETDPEFAALLANATTKLGRAPDLPWWWEDSWGLSPTVR